MKKSLKSLELKKETISKLELTKVKGGGVTNALCNSVPIWAGGIGCVAK